MKDIKHQFVEKGTVILKELPFVYVISSKLRDKNCNYCFESGSLLKCSGCRYNYYCSKICQTDDWTLHKLECKYLKKVSSKVVPDAAMLLCRLILLLGNGGDKVKSYYTDINFRMFKDLMSHYSDIKTDKTRLEHLSTLQGVLIELIGESKIPNSAELLGIYGRMCVNSFSICNQELQSIGTGIYLAASILDHSCKPNAVATFEKKTIYIRTIENIDNFKWEQIFISYIDTMNDTNKIQEELKNTYYFLCQCKRCIDHSFLELTNSSVCPNKKCDEPLNLTNNITCSKCKSTATESFVEQFKRIVELSETAISEMKSIAYIDLCKMCLSKQENVLHKLNARHVKILDMAFESCIEIKKFNDAYTYGVQLIEGFKTYYGSYHPLLGLLYFKLSKICAYLDENRESFVYLKEAFAILAVTHGKNSSLFKKELIPFLQQLKFVINY